MYDGIHFGRHRRESWGVLLSGVVIGCTFSYLLRILVCIYVCNVMCNECIYV